MGENIVHYLHAHVLYKKYEAGWGNMIWNIKWKSFADQENRSEVTLMK